jgi:hypothetical protein
MLVERRGITGSMFQTREKEEPLEREFEYGRTGKIESAPG